MTTDCKTCEYETMCLNSKHGFDGDCLQYRQAETYENSGNTPKFQKEVKK